MQDQYCGSPYTSTVTARGRVLVRRERKNYQYGFHRGSSTTTRQLTLVGIPYVFIFDLRVKNWGLIFFFIWFFKYRLKLQALPVITFVSTTNHAPDKYKACTPKFCPKYNCIFMLAVNGSIYTCVLFVCLSVCVRACVRLCQLHCKEWTRPTLV